MLNRTFGHSIGAIRSSFDQVTRMRQVQWSILAAVSLLAALLLAIGIAATASALSPDRSDVFRLPLGSSASTLNPTRVISILALLAVALLFALRGRRWRLMVACLAAVLAVAVYGMNLDLWFAPSTTFGQRWETYYRTNGNLTEGFQLAANLREGHGYKLDDGSVDTYRMPGYALLVAASGAAGGASARDYRDVAQDTIWMQVVLTAAAVGLFAFAAAARFRRWVILALILVLVALPTNIHFTQGDSVIFAAGLIVTAALLPFLDRARGDAARWRDVVLLHLAFAFYFFVRTDVIFAWAAISLIVHGRRWRHLLVWVALFASIGVGYGAYARANGSEFTFGTNNTGHVAFVGLWELPQDRFVWEPTDESYGRWVTAHHFVYAGPGTNAFAEKEILRFYVTFPGYVTTMAVDKALNFFDVTSLDTNYRETTPFALTRTLRGALVDGGLWLLACAMLAALIIGYRRYETAVLGWAALFVLPVFFFVQDESRFTFFETASFVIAGLPLLLDPGFYRALRTRHRVIAPLALVLLAIWIDRHWIGNNLLAWKGFRYWAPILDPGNSTLAVYK